MMDGSALPQPGETIAGKYVLERVIGEGGMSVVYGSTHRVTGKRFAIKWMLPDETPTSSDTARRFIREAQVAGLFQHPNVVEVYDVGQVSGSFYMVMEWLDGESLATRLERCGAITFPDLCAYLIPSMHGVTEAHSAGIVHRDLKPANIFLCRAMHHTPERPKVLDFGIAKISKKMFDVNSLVTKSGVLIGTPHYLSPEQLRSQPVDHRTDVYAFGVIMYQLLSGQLPFPADNFGQLVLQIATGTPIPLRELVPGLPVGVPEIVSKAMARESEDRFQDLRELVAALEEVAAGRLPLVAAMSAGSAGDGVVAQRRSTPGSGLTYPPNAAKAGPPPLSASAPPGERTCSRDPSGSRMGSGSGMGSGSRTPSGSWLSNSVQLSTADAGAELMEPGSRRRMLALAALAVCVGVGLAFVSVWMLKPQAAAEKSADRVAQPAAAKETTTAASTTPAASSKPAAAAVQAPAEPGAAPAPVGRSATEVAQSASARAGGPDESAATPAVPAAPAAKPKRVLRPPQPIPAAPLQPTAAPAPPQPEPSSIPAVQAPLDRNPLHMKLQ